MNINIINKKENIFVFVGLLALLILPRIAAYFLLGSGIIGTDAQSRYFPQTVRLSENISVFFQQTGPAYSLFLLFFKKLNIDIVSGPVLVQHVLGIITALLVFRYFKKINLPLAFFVTLFAYFSWIALWLEHTILREALASFLMVVLVILVSRASKELKYFQFNFALLAGLMGIALVFVRIEFAVLFVLMPLILFAARKREFPDFKLRDKIFLRWSFGYFCPLIVVLLVYLALPRPVLVNASYGTYDSRFGIAYFTLIPEAFYYENSSYPELQKKYQNILEESGKNKSGEEINPEKRERMGKFYAATAEYLSLRPEINLSPLEIMDQIYLEIMKKNTLIYLKSFGLNLKNHLLGIAELNTLKHQGVAASVDTQTSGNKITQIPFLNSLLWAYNAGLILFSSIVFWLFWPSLAFLLVKWKSLPGEVIISFFIVLIHIPVLAFLADPAHRFRYPIDPFLYFLQFYLIWIFLGFLFAKYVKPLYNKKLL